MAGGGGIDAGRSSGSRRISPTHGMSEGVDWESAEIVDVLPSLSGEPLQGVSPEGDA
jgi:hypothetical protein